MYSNRLYVVVKKTICIILSISVLLCVGSSIVYAGEDTVGVNVSKVKQQNNYYCGAACGVSVLYYYNYVVSQSVFANYASSNPSNGLELSEIQTGLQHWSVNSTEATSSVSFSTVYSNINAGRPIIAGLYYLYQGHAVVLCGATVSTNSIIYMNPSTGSKVGETYTSFKNGNTLSMPWVGTLYRMYKS